MSDISKTKAKIKKAEAEIEGELPWAEVERHMNDVLEELRQDFQAPGFRKGKVPMDIFRQSVSEESVLANAAERALQEAYPLLIEEHELKPLGRPEVTVTKLAAGNPLGFRVNVGVAPEVKLPNYKKISEEVLAAEPAVEVSPEEVEKVINELRQLRAGQAPGGGGPEADKDKKESAEPAQLPELTDEFVKTLGNFENVADFREKLADNIKLEKEAAREKERRERLAEALGAKAKMDLPQSVIEAEAAAMEERLAADLERAKTSMEDYLSKTKKTVEELRAEYRGYAERQIRTRFILDAIAEAENIAAEPAQLAAEVNYLKRQHPDVEAERLAHYAEAMLRNEAVLQFLEGKEPQKPAAGPAGADPADPATDPAPKK